MENDMSGQCHKGLAYRRENAKRRQYERNGELFVSKMLRLMPALILSSLSTLLLSSVDGIFSGRINGSSALAAISLMTPFNVIMAAVTAFITGGILVVLPGHIADAEKTGKIYAASARLVLVAALAVLLLQVPIGWLVVKPMGLNRAEELLFWQYAIGIFLSKPVDIASTVCSFILIANGKNNRILQLSLIEGICNTVLDFLFIVVLKLGVFGAGLGTLFSILTRFGFSIRYLRKETSVFPLRKCECRKEMKEIVSAGFPSATTRLANMITGYVLTWMVADTMGVDGLAVKSVLAFVGSLESMLLLALGQSVGPLLGLLKGGGDVKGMNQAVKSAFRVSLIPFALLTVLCILLHSLIFRLYGFDEIPAIGFTAMVVFTLPFVTDAINTLLNQFFIFSDKEKAVAGRVLMSNAILPVVFAFVFRYTLGGAFIWACYFMGSFLVAATGVVSYRKIVRDKTGEENRSLCVSFTSEDAMAMTDYVREFIGEETNTSLANKTVLVTEELTAYLDRLRQNGPVKVDLHMTWKPGEVDMALLTDGKAVHELESEELSGAYTNYDIVKMVAEELQYKYVYTLNYIKVKITA